MRELTKSLISFSWAQAVFGAQQMLNVLSAPARNGEGATTGLEQLKQTAESQLDTPLKSVYTIGEVVQQEAVDWTVGALQSGASNPAGTVRQASGLMRGALDLLTILATPGSASLFATELANKLQVYTWVKDVGSLLHLPPDGRYVPLHELVDRAYALESFPVLWAVEGAGHYYADSFLAAGQEPRNLLTSASAAAVPEKSMTMLHAGIGLAFAQHLLEKVTLQTTEAQLTDVLARFLLLCRENSQPGYVGAALESLGLVARVYHPKKLVPALDRQLAKLDAAAQAYFWHGVGRGIYFSPTYFLPLGSSPWRAVNMCCGEAPHELGRLNAVAGLTWAMTLVNMRQPEILEVVVTRHGEELACDGAFANGISSAIIVRYDTTPDAPFIAPFCQPQPSGRDPIEARFWEDLVRQPCENALCHYYRVLKERHSLGIVFRCQSLSDLVERLREGPTVQVPDSAVGTGSGSNGR